MSNEAMFQSSDYAPDGLVVGDGPVTGKKVTVKHSAALVRGTVLGTRRLGAVTAAVPVGSGNGIFTPDVTTPLLAGAQAGIYLATCTAAASNSGTFRITDPKGNVLGDVVVGAVFANQIKGVIGDGSNDFHVGDTIAITVAVGDEKVLTAIATAVDGSAEPDLILAEDADASAGDVEAMAYVTGIFNEAQLVLDSSLTADAIRETFRTKGLLLRAAQL